MSLYRLERLEERLQRRKKVNRLFFTRLRDRNNPLEWFNSDEFKLRFHMFKDTAIFVSNLIREYLVSPLKRGCQLPPIIQLLVVIRFYTTGSFQLAIADIHDLSQPTVCSLIKRVSKAIASLRPKFVKYPSFAEAPAIRQAFYEISGFPGVVGSIDCTHIKINSPGGDNPELFRNRKAFFSINVQAICSADLIFTNVVARWYGSAHDSRIFKNSVVNMDLEENKIPGILLGDSGYALSRYVLIPVENPKTAGERRYNYAQISTRNTIERAFGVLKRRFPCLLHLRVKLNTSLAIIVSTTILHNILRSRNDIYDEDQFFNNDEPDEQNSPMPASMSGKAMQNQIINKYFS